MKLLALAATVLVLSTAPGFASFGLMCEGPEGVTASIPLGAGPGLSPLGAQFTVDGESWETGETAGATPIVASQSAAVDDRYYMDFTDTNLEGVVVEVRLFMAAELDEPVLGGTLRIVGKGVWPLACMIG